MFFFPLLLLIIPCFFLFFFLLVSNKTNSKNSQLPPGPSTWGLVCDIFPFGQEYHIWFANLARKHGELMSLRLGQNLIVVASSAAAASQILKTHDRLLLGKYLPAVVAKVPQMAESSIVFGVEKSSWTFLRSICHTQLFSVKAIGLQAKMREEKVHQTLKYLGGKVNQVVSMENLLLATIINMVSNLLISRDLVDVKDETENGKMNQYVQDTVKPMSVPGLGDIHTMLGGLDTWTNANAKKLSMKMKYLWEGAVQERRDYPRQSDESSRGDFLDVLIQNSFSDEKIYILFTELLFGGITSSHATSQWLIIELLRNEAVMHKLREELAVALEQNDLKEDHFLQLPYLQACVKETLRLHHPSPLTTPHRALETCQIMNYTIPKDSLVIVNFRAISRDPLTWEDPLEFKPQRFLDYDRDFRGLQSEFMPFGAGRRSCPGLPLAVKQIPLLVGSLVHRFDWLLPNGSDLKELGNNEKFGLVVTPTEPLVLIPKARSVSQ